MNIIEKLEAFRETESLKAADMARLFGVAPQNYNNWVYRRSLPKDHFKRAEAILGVRHGVQEHSPAYTALTAPSAAEVPLLTYAQAGALSDTTDASFHIWEAADKIVTMKKPLQEVFGLRVEGHSMTLPPGVDGLSFPPGIIVLVDTQAPALNGDLVVAQYGDKKATFRKLMLDEGELILTPLNPARDQYPVIRSDFHVIGRVFDAAYGGF